MTDEQATNPFEALQSLGKNMGFLATEIARLATSTANMEAARKRNFKVTVAFSVIVSVALLLLTGLFVLVQQSANDIRSCVTPTGVCYRQQQARADKAAAQLQQVGNNNRYFVFATNECQLGSPTVKEFHACVLDKVGTAVFPKSPK